jgi:hypothetical protein
MKRFAATTDGVIAAAAGGAVAVDDVDAPTRAAAS